MNGITAGRYVYDAFGNVDITDTEYQFPFRFAGQKLDPETGLYYYKARYYDPALGRFLQVDPIGYADQQNLYAYVGNDPVNMVDPTGMCSESMSNSGILCGISDWIAGKLEPIIERSMEANGIEVVPEGERDPDGIYSHKAGENSAAQEGAALGVAIVDAGMGRIIPGGRRRRCCFVAGTLVDTEDGLRPIEEIVVGDKVWARDTETGDTSLKPVTHLIQRHERVIWEVSLSGQNGKTEFFETTDDHPWWVLGQDGQGLWVTTEDLMPGMVVVSRDTDGPDTQMVITAVTETDRAEATYNLTVADFHTYFVGNQRVLVHNCPIGGGRSPDAQARAQSNVEKGIPETQLGPSGHPKQHTVNHSGRKSANQSADLEAQRAGGSVRNDANPANSKQGPHFQAEDAKGNNVKPVVHHERPKK